MAQWLTPNAVLPPEVSSRQEYVAGIDIGGTNLRVAVADASGAIVARRRTSTLDIRDPELVVARIAEALDDILAELRLPRTALRAVAAGAPGITDVDAGVVIATSYLMGWRDVPLRSLLEDAVGVPAAVDNDVNLAALGEAYADPAQRIRDMVFLAIGTGIGAGIMLNGSLFHSEQWIAGELGYMMVPGTDEAVAGPGEPGALEQIAGGEGIRRQWQTLWNPAQTALPRELTATQIFDRADGPSADLLAQSVLERTSRVLAYAIYNVSLVLNCQLVVLGGSVGLHPSLHHATSRTLQTLRSRALPKLRLSSLGNDAQLHGAVRLAIETCSALHGAKS